MSEKVKVVKTFDSQLLVNLDTAINNYILDNKIRTEDIRIEKGSDGYFGYIIYWKEIKG